MIIAEIGLNHNGKISLLNKILSNLLDSGVDAITLQIREKKFYKKKRFKRYFLKNQIFEDVRKKCKLKKIKFGIALADVEKISFLEKIKVDFIKIIRNDMNNIKFMSQIFNSKINNIYVSTGMSNLRQIGNFLKRAKKTKNKKISLIHTQLNDKVQNVNLQSISFLKKKFNREISFGNHCEELETIFVSLAFRPKSIFFYVKDNTDSKLTLDKKHSVKIKNIKNLVLKIKNLKKTIGKNYKKKVAKNLI